MAEPTPATEPARRPAFLLGLSLRDALVVTALAALAIGARQLLRLPLKLPGHSFTITVFLAVIAVTRARGAGAGTLFGLLTGLLALLLGLGKGGLFEPLRWIVPVAALDGLRALGLAPGRGWVRALLVGALLGALRALTGGLLDVLLGLPADWIWTTLAVKGAAHLGFGALGALLALPILRRWRGVRSAPQV